MIEVKTCRNYICDGCETSTTIYDPPEPDAPLNGSLQGWSITPNAHVCPACMRIVVRLEESGFCIGTIAPSWKESRFIQ